MLKIFASKAKLLYGGGVRSRTYGQITAPFGSGGGFNDDFDAARYAAIIEGLAANNFVDGTENLLYSYARYTVGYSGVGSAFLRVMTDNLISSTPEPPHFAMLKDKSLAKEIGELWLNYYTGNMGVNAASGVEFERAALTDWLTDGEVFITWNSSGQLQAIGPDLINSIQVNRYGQIIGVKLVGEEKNRNPKHLLILANRPTSRHIRGRSFFATALPWMILLQDAGMSDAGAISVMKKLALIVQSPHNPFTGAAGSDNSSSLIDTVNISEAGAVGDDEKTRIRAQRFRISRQTMIMAGAGEDYKRPSTGDTNADFNAFTTSMTDRIAACLGVSPSLISGQYDRHNFASLKVAAVNDNKFLEARRLDWNREFRVPLFRMFLMKIGDKDPRLQRKIMMNIAALQNPKWFWPLPQSVEPMKDIQVLEAKAKIGLTNLDEVANMHGQNRPANMKANKMSQDDDAKKI